MAVSAMRASSSMYGRSCRPPRAQLSPTTAGRACRMEFQKASVVWPDNVRPDASLIVPETMMGRSKSSSSSTSRTAKRAALAFKVSNTVSIRMTSTPPVDECARGLGIAGRQFVETDVAESRIVDVGRQ